MTYVSDMSTRLSGMDWDMVASTGANNKERIVSWLVVVFFLDRPLYNSSTSPSKKAVLIEQIPYHIIPQC